MVSGPEGFCFAFRDFDGLMWDEVMRSTALLKSDAAWLRIKKQNYQSDIYTLGGWTYYPRVVWQFWGRAAEAS